MRKEIEISNESKLKPKKEDFFDLNKNLLEISKLIEVINSTKRNQEASGLNFKKGYFKQEEALKDKKEKKNTENILITCPNIISQNDSSKDNLKDFTELLNDNNNFIKFMKALPVNQEIINEKQKQKENKTEKERNERFSNKKREASCGLNILNDLLSSVNFKDYNFFSHKQINNNKNEKDGPIINKKAIYNNVGLNNANNYNNNLINDRFGFNNYKTNSNFSNKIPSENGFPDLKNQKERKNSLYENEDVDNEEEENNKLFLKEKDNSSKFEEFSKNDLINSSSMIGLDSK